jgi:uncharacterized protein (DUF2336 family)
MKNRQLETLQPGQRTYEENKSKAVSKVVDTRRELAARDTTEPEILYYLTDDTDTAVRKNIAGNSATPIQANFLLAEDEVEEVRAELARKICRILPDISGSDAEELLDQTIEVLEILAADQEKAVRAIISESLKESRNIPKHIVMALARDVEEIVAGPILEYSPLLSDNDLLEIIAAGVAVGALPAIASREKIGEEVSASIAARLEIPAVAALLANPSAKIREETMNQIIDQAEQVDKLHEPLILRLDLSLRAVRRITGFVASSLLESLSRKHKLSREMEKELKLSTQVRIEETEQFAQLENEEHTMTRAEEMWAAGQLDEEAVSEAVKRKDHSFVSQAISLMSGYSPKTINAMLSSRNGKVVISLCWKAGLSMRLAFDVQTRIAHVSRKDIINARNGVEYPFTDEEMDWQLSFYSDT